MDELISLAKRLADYVRMTIETGELKIDSPIGIAYRDFIAEWDKCHLPNHLSKAAGACALWNSCKLKLSEGGCLPNCAKRTPPA